MERGDIRPFSLPPCSPPAPPAFLKREGGKISSFPNIARPGRSKDLSEHRRNIEEQILLAKRVYYNCQGENLERISSVMWTMLSLIYRLPAGLGHLLDSPRLNIIKSPTSVLHRKLRHRVLSSFFPVVVYWINIASAHQYLSDNIDAMVCDLLTVPNLELRE